MYKGYDKSNDSVRYGFHPKYKDKRIFRIKLDEDRRDFLPVGRKSKKFKRLYKKRTSVESLEMLVNWNRLFKRASHYLESCQQPFLEWYNENIQLKEMLEIISRVKYNGTNVKV